jgi:hypothetical protein
MMRKSMFFIVALAWIAGTGNAAHAQFFPPQMPVQQMSNRCFTPLGVCLLPQFGPVGLQCFCNTMQGPVGGQLR